jgi:hypothetical protein
VTSSPLSFGRFAVADPSSSPAFLQDAQELGSLARQSGLVKRRARKLCPLTLLHSLLQASCHQRASTRQLAFLAGLLCHSTLARQSFWERLREPAAAFMAAVLGRLLKEQSGATSTAVKLPGVQRVLVADSSIVALHASLRHVFTGSSNQCVSTASARMQFAFDLLEGRLIHCGLHPFTRPDQAAAHDVLDCLRPGDLLMRDLGYFVLEAFEKIDRARAFFLSRLRYQTALYDAQGTQLDLLKELRRQSQLAPGRPVVLEVTVGTKHRVPMRLVAVPLPEAQANERRRRARQDRDKRLSHSQDYYQLLSWTLLVTNLPTNALSPVQLQALYALRWRIENIFKAWKSHLKPEATTTHRTNQHHLRCLLYAQQILLAIAASRGLLATMAAPSTTTRAPRPSLFKQLDLLMLTKALLPPWPGSPPTGSNLTDNFLYHSCYDKRRRHTLPAQVSNLLS